MYLFWKHSTSVSSLLSADVPKCPRLLTRTKVKSVVSWHEPNHSQHTYVYKEQIHSITARISGITSYSINLTGDWGCSHCPVKTTASKTCSRKRHCGVWCASTSLALESMEMGWNQFPCSPFCLIRRYNPSPPSSHSFGQLRFQGKLRRILGPYPSWSWTLGQAPQKMFQGMMGRCLVGGHKALLTSNYPITAST